MANPRKFSEKIALHTHRQAEETARFEQIMREVSDATAKPEDNLNHTKQIHHRGRARNQAGPMRRPHERRLDTSPYSNSSYLSLPPDTSWGSRRANSDSALHQSVQGTNSDKNDNCSNKWMMSPCNDRSLDRKDMRPRSSCEMPRINPGIHIYASPNIPGTVQIPIGSNTGSLPDLTNVDFASPIAVPIDQEREGHSPYSSSSPTNVSPSTLSPTMPGMGIKHQQHNGRFQFQPGISPTHPNHLSVPGSNMYRPHKKTLDNNIPIVIDNTAQINGIYNQVSPASTSPVTVQTDYRNTRPSPQSSPTLGGRHSAPCSPGTPSPLPYDYHVFNQYQATQFQQHFEQLSVMDSPISTMTYPEQQQPSSSQMPNENHHTLQDNNQGTLSHLDIATDAGYYSTSPSQMIYGTTAPSLHTTPNTPTSIPDITLTDFSSAAEEASRNDLSVKQFESEFFSEDALRGSLEPLDLDSFQILADNGINFIPDTIEEHFKLDRS